MVNLDSFYQLARKEERLFPLVKQFMGLKPPCFPSIFDFPDASTIMHCNIGNLREIGFSQRKSEALINLASAITSQKDTYSKLEQKPDKNIVESLSNLKGIGLWSIEYAMLRGLGRIEILPGDDVGFQKKLKKVSFP